MTPEAAAIAEMYRLTGDAFKDRCNTLDLNIKRSILDDFLRTRNQPFGSLLQTLCDSITKAHKLLATEGMLSQEQYDDFESRLDTSTGAVALAIESVYPSQDSRDSRILFNAITSQLELPVV